VNGRMGVRSVREGRGDGEWENGSRECGGGERGDGMENGQMENGSRGEGRGGGTSLGGGGAEKLLTMFQIITLPLSSMIFFQAPFWEWSSSHLHNSSFFSLFSLFSCLLFCILLHASPPGRFWTCPIPSSRRNSGQSGPAGRLHSVVLRADSFLSSQPGPPCFHSLG
jgi:hypothetical protein